MTEALLTLPPLILAGFAVFFRVGAFFGMLPGFGEASVPMRIKLGIAAAFTLIVLPLVPLDGLPQVWTPPVLVGFVLTEAAIGLVFGIGMRLFLLGLQTAGTIAAQSTSLAQVFGNASVEPMPAMGHVLMVGGIALAMIADLHVKAAALFVTTYALFPMGQILPAGSTADWGVAQVAHAFRLAFTLAVPFVILSMLYNVALGVINKAMPQLMVAFVGAPAITLGGLFLLFTSAPLMLQVWHSALDAYLINPMGPR